MSVPLENKNNKEKKTKPKSNKGGNKPDKPKTKKKGMQVCTFDGQLLSCPLD